MKNLKNYDEYLNEEVGGKTIFSILLSLLLSYGSLKSQTNQQEIQKYGKLLLNETEDMDETTTNLYKRIINLLQEDLVDIDEILKFVESTKDIIYKNKTYNPLYLDTLKNIKNGDIIKMKENKMSFSDMVWRNKFDPEKQKYTIDIIKNNKEVIIGVIVFALLLTAIKHFKQYKNRNKEN